MNNSKKSNLIGNIKALGILQIFNYILPFLLIPYLIQVLSVDLYGSIILAQTLVLYFMIFIDYGFSLSATRDVSLYRDNRTKLTEVFSSVMTIKFFLLIVSIILFTSIILFFDRFYEYKELYFLMFISVVGHAMFPVWYFQGIEEMKHITIVNIISKSFFTLLTFYFVSTEVDYLYVPIFYSLGYLVSGIWSLWIVFDKYNERLIIQKNLVIKKYFKDSTQFFWSRLSSVGYSNTNTFLVGLLLSPQYVTYYFLADKIISVILSIYYPVQQAIYPYLTNKFDNKMYLYAFFLTIGSSFLIMIFITFFSDYISLILLKENVIYFTKTLDLLVYLIPISIAYVMIGAPLLLAKGYVKEFNNSIIYGFLIHLCLLVIVYWYSQFVLEPIEILLSFSAILIISKTIVLLLRGYYVYKHKLHKGLL